MTICDEVRRELSAYLDGELAEPERERVRQHVSACPACAHELSELRDAAALLGRLEETDPPDSIERNLRARMRRRAAEIIVGAGLLLVAIWPIAAMFGLVIYPNLPLWARAGFGLATASLAIGLGALIWHLLRNARSLLIYGYLSGGRQ